jgi:hypothetical protein
MNDRSGPHLVLAYPRLGLARIAPATNSLDMRSVFPFENRIGNGDGLLAELSRGADIMLSRD